MVEEVGELELGDELPKGKLAESRGCEALNVEIQNESDPPEGMPWLLFYRVWGQSMYKEEGSPDRGVMSLTEGPS